MKRHKLIRATLFAALLYLPLPFAYSLTHDTNLQLETLPPPAKRPAPPAVPEDACSVARETYRKLPLDVVRQVQDGLAYFNLYANRIDNIVGIDTRAGLAAYCRMRGMTLGTSPASHQALLDELLRDSAIDRVYHGWRDILASPGFSPWAAGQQDNDQIRIQIKSGTPAEVIDIIDRYLKYRPESPKPRAASWPDNQAISYRLGADDFAALATRQSVLDKLVKIKGSGFQEKADFVAQVNELLAGETEAQAALSLVENYADSLSVVTLGPLGMARLRAARVPDDILESLGELEDPGYPSQDEAQAAIRALLAEAGAETEAAATLPPGKDEMAGINGKWLPLILSQLEESTAYRLSDKAWDRLSAATGAIPGYVLPMLKGLEEVDYPLRSLFIAAAKTRISTRLNEYNRTLKEEVSQQRRLQLDDAFFESLKKNQFPDELAARLSPLKGKTYPSERELHAAIDSVLQAEIERFTSYREYLATQARKKHQPDASKTVLWSSVTDCKCLPSKMKDQVYGFYPFWLAGEEKTVDFGNLSRVGYYALDFNEQGAVQTTLDWATHSSAAFETAKRFRTSMDLVIAKRDWSAWSAQQPEDRAAAFRALAANIGKLLGIKPEDRLSRLKPYISLGTNQPSLGNGVTLFFEHYPEEAEYVEEFRGFITTLHTTLADSGYFVNLMLPRDALGHGIFKHANLLRWAQLYSGKAQTSTEASGHMLILVLLAEPYSTDKKALRRDIEENLPGADRRDLLRMMIPVIVPDGHSPINDDVIYMGDNFAGIGFWPLPADAAGQQNNAILKQEYFPDSTNQTSEICGIVCPNRWLFRLAFNFFLITTLVSLAGFLWCCECRTGIRRHFIPILAGTALPLILVGMALLACDPFLEDISGGNDLLFLVLLGIIAYAVWEYWQRRQEIP